MLNRMFLARMTRWASPAGRNRRSTSARLSRPGTALIHVGERCSIVTLAASAAMAAASAHPALHSMQAVASESE